MITMGPAVWAAYVHMRDQVIEYNSENMRALGAILLNTYNERIPGTGFRAGRFRCLDSKNQDAVITYLRWYGSIHGHRPPEEDMVVLKKVFLQREWNN